MELTLTRLIKTQNSIIGELTGLKGRIFTLEDAWRENQANISCIPAGRYKCAPHGWEANPPYRFTKVWRVSNVPNRSAILFHIGNTHEDTRGCILVGFDMRVVGGEASVLNSAAAIRAMREQIGSNGFNLVVQ